MPTSLTSLLFVLFISMLFLIEEKSPRSPPEPTPIVRKKTQQGPPVLPPMLSANVNSSLVMATLDVSALPPGDRSYVRYLWVPDGTPENIKAVSFTMNWLSNMAIPWKPIVVGGVRHGKEGRSTAVIRVDLRRYARDSKDLDRWLKTWEELSYDPNYSVLITPDTINLLADSEGHYPPPIQRYDKETRRILVDAPETTDPETGEKIKSKWVSTVRLVGQAIDQRLYGNLSRSLHTEAPVVHYQYFIMRALSSIKEEGLYKDVFGGLYYEFAGVRTAKEAGKKKATDLDVLFEDLGVIDDADGPIKAFDKIDRLQAEQRVAMIRSKVTGKIRAVAFIPTFKTARRRQLVAITLDVNDKSIDIQDNVFFNLLKFVPKAMEVIWVDANGSQKYALFNGQGALQNEVPFDVANDTTVPDPYTKRLHTISCITCHGKQDGWQPAPNEIAPVLGRLRGTRGSLEILTDVSDKKRSLAEVLELIYSKYAGNVDETLMDLRRNLIGAVLEMTGPWQEGDRTQVDVYKVTARKIDDLRKSYWYTPIDARIALQEMGVDPGSVDPLNVIRDLLPPDVASRNDYFGLVSEDIRIRQLTAGLSISRAHWELVKGFAAGRVYQTLSKKRGGKV